MTTKQTTSSATTTAKPKRKPAPKAAPDPKAATAAPAPTGSLPETVATSFKFATPDFDAMLSFSTGNLDAFMKAGSVAIKGGQDMQAMLLEGLMAALDESAATTKALMDCQSVPEFVELQSGFARTSYEKLLADGQKISETTFRVTEEAVGPIAERFAVAVERFGFPDAA